MKRVTAYAVAICYSRTMAISSTPIRLDATLVDTARLAAKTLGRSVAQQIAHWARLGRELEASPDVSLDNVVAMLEGRQDYDALSLSEQAVLRREQAMRMEALRAGLRMDVLKAERQQSYAELNEAGEVVIRTPE